ncbi:MAG TPA: peptidyl-prolyl cis-trans isomerase [Polyangiaceae bacterium]
MRRLLVFPVLVATLLATRADTRADDASAPPSAAADAARRAMPVAQIGPSRTITVGELEDRIAAMPPFQRATFGATPDAVKHEFLLQVLIPESLFAQGAAAEKLDEQLPTAFEVERARSRASIRAIRERLGPESAIPMADVQAYYDANRDRYDTPERWQVWRILCKTQEEAQGVLDAAKKDPTPKTFADLARDHSIDKGSNLRAGNIGFINPDGTSSEPGLKVDPAVVRAVQTVKDGQLVPAAVKEPDGYDVVWRRGSIPANKRSVDDVAAQIRDTLWKQRVKDETDKLVAGLRATHLKDYDEAPVTDPSLVIVVDGGIVSAPHDAAAK